MNLNMLLGVLCIVVVCRMGSTSVRVGSSIFGERLYPAKQPSAGDTNIAQALNKAGSQSSLH
jgi:hypothetical protein